MIWVFIGLTKRNVCFVVTQPRSKKYSLYCIIMRLDGKFWFVRKILSNYMMRWFDGKIFVKPNCQKNSVKLQHDVIWGFFVSVTSNCQKILSNCMVIWFDGKFWTLCASQGFVVLFFRHVGPEKRSAPWKFCNPSVMCTLFLKLKQSLIRSRARCLWYINRSSAAAMPYNTSSAGLALLVHFYLGRFVYSPSF